MGNYLGNIWIKNVNSLINGRKTMPKFMLNLKIIELNHQRNNTRKLLKRNSINFKCMLRTIFKWRKVVTMKEILAKGQ